MRQRRSVELFNDYDYQIRYHPGKAKIVAGALGRKERMKPRRAQAMRMTIHSSNNSVLLEAQSEASKGANTSVEMLKGLDKQFKKKKMSDYISLRESGLILVVGNEEGCRFTLAITKKALGTRLDLSTPYHPEIDSQSKRTIQTLEDMLRPYAIDFGGNWDTHLPLVELSYNNYRSSVKYSPFEALYGGNVEHR
uniref:Putative reverse transcriptase domain-containing protein n=1 Tax=Tanacetum cinerariifolium TaxID=118510 RepID=A0A6L2NF51_TANCI|nr:putative reverse transcriptase domain-containing protein [Tanacetum cinerariifolium]